MRTAKILSCAARYQSAGFRWRRACALSRVELIPYQHAEDEPRMVSGNKLSVMTISGRTISKQHVIKNLMTEEHLDPIHTYGSVNATSSGTPPVGPLTVRAMYCLSPNL